MYSTDILLIEDNPNDAELILGTLRDMTRDFKIVTVRDGVEALNYFFGPGGCLLASEVCLPKFILLDLKLPRVGGLEVLQQIKSDERTKTIPTVVFSSSDEEHDRVRCYRCGANSYIVKPVDADQFSATVEAIGRYWISKNRVGYGPE